MIESDANVPQRETHHIALKSSIEGLEEAINKLRLLRDKIECGDVPPQPEAKVAQEVLVLSLGNILAESPKEIRIQTDSLLALTHEIESKLF